MQKNKQVILSTRPLNHSLIKEAAEDNVLIDCVPFIRTEIIKIPELNERVQQLALQNASVVFTSMNAVEAVKEYLLFPPNWKVFSIGQKTKELIVDFFGAENLAGTGDDASQLADVIINHGPQKLTFFCGDQRRDELPEKLIRKGINLEEMVVYETISVSQKIGKHYDGVLFFSPSAVESFFLINTIDNATIIFAIGNTTANTIRQKVNNKIVIADKPGKEALVKKMLDYFSQQKKIINE